MIIHAIGNIQDEFLDVVYWLRQILGLILGVVWGVLPLKGFLGIVLLVLRI